MCIRDSYFTMFFTPGPNNAMLTASGMKFGFIRTLPHLIGISLGHVLQIGLTCFGLANLFLFYPQVQFYMKILCFLYLLYLGWKMIGSFSSIQKEKGRPLRFYEASLFQFINPKGVMAGVTLSSNFVEQGENYLNHSIWVIVVCSVTAFLSITSWTFLGKFLRKFATNNNFIKRFNYAMSLLLIVCIIGFYI